MSMAVAFGHRLGRFEAFAVATNRSTLAKNIALFEKKGNKNLS